MKIEALIQRLNDYREQHGNVDVRLMTQPSYPLEHRICGVTSGVEMNEFDECESATSDEVVYIVEGEQLGYGNKSAWQTAD